MNILEEANQITSQDRNNDYGHPKIDFARTAIFWSVLFGTEVKPEQIPLAMILLKLSRQINKHKRDNLVDIAGFARTREMMDSEPMPQEDK